MTIFFCASCSQSMSVWLDPVLNCPIYRPWIRLEIQSGEWTEDYWMWWRAYGQRVATLQAWLIAKMWDNLNFHPFKNRFLWMNCFCLLHTCISNISGVGTRRMPVLGASCFHGFHIYFSPEISVMCLKNLDRFEIFLEANGHLVIFFNNIYDQAIWDVVSCLFEQLDPFFCLVGYLLSLVFLNSFLIGFQIPIPEKPPSDDLTEIQKWKWSVRKAKKINQERHSQRCDTELKLSVRYSSLTVFRLIKNLLP